MASILRSSWRRRQHQSSDIVANKSVTPSTETSTTTTSQSPSSHGSLKTELRLSVTHTGSSGSSVATVANTDTRCAQGRLHTFKAAIVQAEIKKAAQLATCIRTQDAKLAESRALRHLQKLRFSSKVIMSPLHGSYNILFPIQFRDRVQWLLKIPANGSNDQWDEASAEAHTSEAMTMKFIYNNSPVPVPRIYSFDSTANNLLKCPYMLLERIKGKSPFYGWFYKQSPDRFRQKLIDEVAHAMVKLSVFNFPKVGALQFDSDGKVVSVGPYRKVDHFAPYHRKKLGQDSVTTFSQHGPFTDPRDYFLTSLDREDASKSSCELQGQRKLLRLFIDWFFQAASTLDDTSGFVLTHPDFNIQNMLVSKDGTLRTLIDWDGVVVVPRCLGFEEYPLWLTRDWDPHFWNYNAEGDCAIDPYQPFMDSEELLHYRSVYAQALEAASSRSSVRGPSPDGSNKSVGSAGGGCGSTRISCLARSLYIAANEPESLPDNLEMIFDRIVDLTAEDEEEQNEGSVMDPDHDANLEDLEQDIGSHYGSETGQETPKPVHQAEGGQTRQSSCQWEVTGEAVLEPQVVPASGCILQLDVDNQEERFSPEDVLTCFEPDQMSRGTPAKNSFQSVTLDPVPSTTHWPSQLLTQLWTISYHLLAVSAMFMLIMSWLQSKDMSPMIMISIGFLFSETLILSNLIAFLLGVSLFVRILGRVFDSGLGNYSDRRSHLIQEAFPLQVSISAESASVQGAQDPIPQSIIIGHDTVVEIAKATGSVQTEEVLHDNSMAKFTMARDMIDCDRPRAEDTACESINNLGPESSCSSEYNSSPESTKSGSTHTEMEIHTNHAGSDAGFGEEDDDNVSITSDYVLDMILKKWDEDPSYDFGHFTDRNVYNALYNDKLDAARTRRLKIGFQRLLTSLDNRFADFDGLTLSYERFDSKIFIISVGEEKKEYAVHEAVLKKSPVFAAMCKGQFKEAHERRITLPVDNPQDVAAIVEYMYMDNFTTIGNPNAGSDHQTCALQLASLYMVAEYYQIDPLKALIVKKFKTCTTKSTPAQWLAVAALIYPSLRSTDDIYPAYMRSLIIDCLNASGNPPDPAVMEELEQCVQQGGRLAVDINRACTTYWRQRGAAVVKELRKITARAEDLHLDHHWRCRKCHFRNFRDKTFLLEFEDAKGGSEEVVDEEE
ncbi:MAG: hypothetical protein Q9210_004458 [Variospora velana]